MILEGYPEFPAAFAAGELRFRKELDLKKSEIEVEAALHDCAENYRLKKVPEGWVIVRVRDEAQHAVAYSTRRKAKLAERNLRLGLIRFQPPAELILRIKNETN